jgi:hypothetical protein
MSAELLAMRQLFAEPPVAEGCRNLAFRHKIQQDGLRLFPIRRDLQDCRSAEAAMGDQHLFPEALAIACGDDFS